MTQQGHGFDSSDLESLRATVRQVASRDHTLRSLGELGLLGLLVPDSAGGEGWWVVEACAVAVELGRALSPVPWAATALAAAELARHPDFAPTVAGMLRGEVAGVVAARSQVDVDEARSVVTGQVVVVAPASTSKSNAEVVLLAHDGSASLRVGLDERTATLTPLADPLDTTRTLARLTLHDAPAVPLPGAGRFPPTALATLLACADSLGALTATVERIDAYLRDREAFGRPIASFQAIQHRLVDLTVLVEAAGALLWRAATAVATGSDDAPELVDAMYAYLSRRCPAALDDCIQLSGGIGFTWEWPVHHAMRRCMTTLAPRPPRTVQRTAGRRGPTEPAERARFRERVRSVIAEHAPGPTREGHRAPTSPEQEAALRAWYRTLYDEGLLGADWPTEWGGRPDHEPWQDLVVVEELIRARAPRPIDQVLLASHVLLRFGTDEQRARYLPRIRSGEDIWCQLFSEPGAGSDLAGITARATRRDDGSWVLAGQKTWTTDGHWAQMGLALLRTAPPATRHAGITAFAVPMDSENLVVRPIRTIGGALEFNEVFLDGVVLGPQHVIGEVNQGWAVAMSGLEVERFTVGGNVVMLELLLDDVVAVARRVAAPGTDAYDDTWAVIEQWRGEYEAARAFITGHAERATAGTSDPTDAPIAKILYTETYNWIARFGVELVTRHLPLPADLEPVAQRLSDAWLWSRAMTISGGSSEVMRNILARRRLKLPSHERVGRT